MDNDKVKAELVKMAEEKLELMNWLMNRGKELMAMGAMNPNNKEKLLVIQSQLDILLEVSEYLRKQK